MKLVDQTATCLSLAIQNRFLSNGMNTFVILKGQIMEPVNLQSEIPFHLAEGINRK